jgi:alkylation response protein AidB-like acyl-CoA dehydrogenase
MDFEWEPEHRAFLEDLRDFIQKWRTPELLAEYFATYGAGGPELTRFREALEEKGWARMCWPVEQGGQGKNLLFQFLFVEEMEYWGMPYGNLTYTSIGPSIQRFGSEEQKQRWLPGIWGGESTFAIGYSEPNAGTDLASLRTRAVRVGDEWVINGQKIWTSLADVATHIWLAARTDPDLPKHQGISVFVVPTDVPGLTIRPLHAMYGGHTCETFYDDVRVPADHLVGGLNQGWGIVMHALNHERVGLAATGGLARLFDQLVAHLVERDRAKLEDPLVRRRLAELALDLHEHRALALRNAWIISKGGMPIAEASMSKVYVTELLQRLALAGVDMLGVDGLWHEVLFGPRAGAPLRGRFAYEVIERIHPTVSVGANEIQRDTIARFGLQLPVRRR